MKLYLAIIIDCYSDSEVLVSMTKKGCELRLAEYCKNTWGQIDALDGQAIPRYPKSIIKKYLDNVRSSEVIYKELVI